MCQSTLEIILAHGYSLDGACYNDGNSKYVVLTRSGVKWYELNNIVN